MGEAGAALLELFCLRSKCRVKLEKNAKNISYSLHFEPEKESNELNGNAEKRRMHSKRKENE